MRLLASLAIVVCLFVLNVSPMSAASTASGASQNAAQKKSRAPEPVAIEDGTATLNPKNTSIQFIGTHVGPRPDPRVGYFTKFTGELAVDAATKAPASAELEIATASLVTPIAKLTNHLHTPDFFDVRQYPEATFKSTKIETVDATRGKYKIIGELTIRDVKKPISFPATVRVSDAGILLASKFKIKRSEFGMTFGPDRVEDVVTMTVTIGKPTPKVTPQ